MTEKDKFVEKITNYIEKNEQYEK